MSQRGGGFRGGRFKGRNRHSPYSRGGAGGGGYRNPDRKTQRNSGGGQNLKNEPEMDGSFQDAPPEVPPPTDEGVRSDEQLVVGTPGTSGPHSVRAREGPSPSHAHHLGADLGPSRDDGEVVKEKKRYSVKARLFVGNLPKDTSQDTVKEMFQRFGEVREVFVQREKNFGFIRMAYRSEAECAVADLDGKNFKGREMKVRFASSNSAVKVSNLHPLVSNELLEEAFAQFGEVEQAVVVTDERGKSLGHGIVDFSRKGYAQNAMRRCSDDHFLLTKSPMPVMVEEYLRDNDEDGQPERSIARNASFRTEREVPPRFALPNSVEHAVATQWKMAYESEKRQREELEQHLRQARNNLVNEMENIREQHQTELLRQELAHHQQEQLRLVQQLRRRQGNLVPLNSSMMEPNDTGGLASLFPGQPPPGPPPGQLSQTSGEHPMEEMPPQAVMEAPGYGGGSVAPPVMGSTSYPAVGMAMLPPPLMGQHSLF